MAVAVGGVLEFQTIAETLTPQMAVQAMGQIRGKGEPGHPFYFQLQLAALEVEMAALVLIQIMADLEDLLVLILEALGEEVVKGNITAAAAAAETITVVVVVVVVE